MRRRALRAAKADRRAPPVAAFFDFVVGERGDVKSILTG